MTIQAQTPIFQRIRNSIQSLQGSSYMSLFKDVGVYAGGGMLIRSVSFFTVPILTRALSQQEYAILDIISAVQGLVSVVIGLNLDTALARYYYEYKTEGERREFVSTLTSSLSLLGLLSTIIVFLLSNGISVLLFHTPEYSTAIKYSSIGIPAGIIGMFGLSVIRFEKKPVQFAVISFIGALLQFGLVFLAIYVYSARVDLVVLSQVLGQLLILIIVTIRNRTLVRPVLLMTILRRCLRFSLPQYPSVFISWYLNSANRFFLVSLGSLVVVSKFAVASKLNAIVVGFMQAFANAWLPFATSIMNVPEAKKVYANIMYIVVVILSVLTIVAALVAPMFLILYAGPSYSDAAFSATILILATCVGSGFSWFVSIGLYVKEKPFFFTVAQIGTFISNTLFNILLIPILGSDGAALAVLAGSVVQVIVLTHFSNKVYPFPYRKVIWLVPTFAFLVIMFQKFY